MADPAIYEVDPANGAVRTVVRGRLALPTDLALTEGPEGEQLHVADVFSYRVINTASGEIADPLRLWRDGTGNQLGIGGGKSKVLITSWLGNSVTIFDRASHAQQTIQDNATPMDALELSDGRLVVLEGASGAISLIEPGNAVPAP
jgi:hypothetical protein